MNVPFVDLNREIASLTDELVVVFGQVIRDSNFILGPEVASFEEEFASFCGCEHGIGVASGTDALLIALKAYGIGPGNEVLTAANTFIATFDAISRTGATPVPVDPDPDYYTVDMSGIQQSVTSRTTAILPVHLFGQTADMEALLGISSEAGVPLIEDAAQAHGALYKGKRAGSLGDCGCFSFYPSKNLGAFGDGGMVTTSDGPAADRMRALRNYGQRTKNVHDEIGLNSRLDELQAGLLRVRLRYLDENNELRRKAADRYRERLDGIPGVNPPQEREGCRHVYHLFVVRCPQRDRLREHLARRGISTGMHYPVPPHLQPAYRHLGYKPGSFPIAERLAGEMLSLPMFPRITEDEIDYVCSNIADFYRTGAQ